MTIFNSSTAGIPLARPARPGRSWQIKLNWRQRGFGVSLWPYGFFHIEGWTPIISHDFLHGFSMIFMDIFGAAILMFTNFTRGTGFWLAIWLPSTLWILSSHPWVGPGDECFPSPPGQRQRDNGGARCDVHHPCGWWVDVVVHDVLCQR